MPPFPIRKFSVAEYHRMIDADVLTEDDAVELLEGWIVPKMPRKPPHDGTIQLTEDSLRRVLPGGWTLRIQSAITTSDSEPEPDLAAVRGDVRTYLLRHPTPAEVGLVIEISDSTLIQDRQDKGRLYARANIPHYWVVNLVDRVIEAYADPGMQGANPAYQSRRDYQPHETIPLILDNQVIAMLPVADLLP
jgi:hypothetical protein